MSEKRPAQLLDRLAKIKDSMKRKTTPLAEAMPNGPREEPTETPTQPRAPAKTSAERGRSASDESQLDAAKTKPPVDSETNENLDGLLNRLNDLAPAIVKPESQDYTQLARIARDGHRPDATPQANPKARTPRESRQKGAEFFPLEPTSFSEAGLNNGVVEELVLKYMLATGETTGHGISDQLRLAFPLIADFLGKLKYDQLVQYRGTTALNDYVCCLTDLGRERARRHSMRCTYFGAAPVTIWEYRKSVEQQSLRHQHPGADELKRAFSDLLIDPSMLIRLGAAMNSGRGMFLYGYPGNGKTSIAERITKAFGEYIWIPRAVGVDGEVIRLFDPTQHEELPLDQGEDLVKKNKIDTRWVRIRRPTIIVGGELTMENLELSVNSATGVNEAPVQMKSNCGTLVIDDFGRQRISVDELLNRWIVPLEKRIDFLNMPSGKKIEIPFDQLVVFSTNLEPKDLVDDAFLRRIPYKINVENPTEAAFRKLFEILAPKMGFESNNQAITYLIEKHYQPSDRPFRCCHPRDLLLQIVNYCKYTRQSKALTPAYFDFAAENYFSMM